MYGRILYIVLSLWSSIAAASFVIRGGGKVCMSDDYVAFDRLQIERADPFLFEDLGLSSRLNQNEVEKILFLNLLESEPALGYYLLDRYSQVKSLLSDATADHLGMVLDSHQYLLPSSCPVVEVIEQHFDPLTQKSSFFIQSNIWSELSPLDRVFLVLHETLYREWFLSSSDELAEASFTWKLTYQILAEGTVESEMLRGGLACRFQ